MSFENRHVVVTGGAGALGGAVVRRLVREGATCHLPVRSAASAEGPDVGPRERVHVVPGVDLTDEPSVVRFYEGLPVPWASIHCAGTFSMAPVENTSVGEFEMLLGVNAVSAFLCCREAVRAMRRAAGSGRASGRIVNVAAMPALEPRRGAGMAAYAASKAAVSALTEALAEELAGEDVRVNAVAPSILDTEANRRAMPDADFDRWPKVDEVAEVIAVLASPAGSAVRGSIVKVYGRS